MSLSYLELIYINQSHLSYTFEYTFNEHKKSL